MACPQKENGYTPIANELLEQFLLYRFPPNTEAPRLIWLYIARKTFGFSKKDDIISLSQFEKGTGLPRNTVVYWLNYLVKALLLVKGVELDKNGYTYTINKNYDEWIPLVKALKLVKGRLFTSKSPLTKTSKSPLTHINKKQYIQKQENLFLTLKFMNEELEYIYSEVKHSKSKYGKKTMFVLAGFYLQSKCIQLEKDESYDIAPISQGISKLLKKAGDVEKTKQILFDGAEYFKQRNLDWKPITIYNNWYEIQKWLKEGKPKNNKETNKLNPDLYE